MHLAVKLAGQVFRRRMGNVFKLAYLAGPPTIIELSRLVLPEAVSGVNGDFFVSRFLFGILANRIPSLGKDLHQRFDSP